MLEVSYNEPKLSPCTKWDPNGITLTIPMDTAFMPRSLFVHRKNTLYIADQYSSQIYLQQADGHITTKITLDPSFAPAALFVITNEMIYVSSSNTGVIEKLTANTNISVRIMNISSPCWTLFADANNSIYCSLYRENRVAKISLYSNVYKLETVAGNGSLGSTSSTLSQPNGIFVDINFHLYVADCLNNRVQLFKFGNLNGTTVAGTGARSTITLLRPTVVFMDADGYLFIVDRAGRRIVGSRSTGFYCIIGCSDGSEAITHQLYNVRAARFLNLIQ